MSGLRACRSRRVATLMLLLGASSAAGMASWTLTPRAHAQASQAAGSEARELFREAMAELHAGHFPEARDRLVRAQALAPNAAIAFNLAVAYRGTGQLLLAEQTLTGMLESELRLSASQRTEATGFREAVRAEIGTLRVEVSGAQEAELRLDGARIEAGSLRVDPGDHIVIASAVDHTTREERVHVGRGETIAVSIALEPTAESLVGTLVLEAPDPELLVEIVGGPSARGRLEASVPPGEHRVRVRHGDSAHEASVVVRARSQTRYTFADPRSRPIVEEPLLWIVGGIVLAGAAVGLAVGLTLPPPRDAPVSDPVFGVIMALGD